MSICIAGQFLNEVQEIGELTPAASLTLSRSASYMGPPVSFEAAAAAAIAAANVIEEEPTQPVAGMHADTADQPAEKDSAESGVQSANTAAEGGGAQSDEEPLPSTAVSAGRSLDSDLGGACSGESESTSTLIEAMKGLFTAERTSDSSHCPSSELAALSEPPKIGASEDSSAVLATVAEGKAFPESAQSTEGLLIGEAKDGTVADPLQLEPGMTVASGSTAANTATAAAAIQSSSKALETPSSVSLVSVAEGASSSADAVVNMGAGSEIEVSGALEGGGSKVEGASPDSPSSWSGSAAGETEEQHICDVCGITTASEAHMLVISVLYLCALHPSILSAMTGIPLPISCVAVWDYQSAHILMKRRGGKIPLYCRSSMIVHFQISYTLICPWNLAQGLSPP